MMGNTGKSESLDLRRHPNGSTSRLASTAAHELRTPLTAIVGYLEMLLDGEFGPLTADQRESIEAMDESAQHLKCAADDLLDVTGIWTGEVALALRPTDLPALLQTAADEAGPHLEAKAQHLTLNASPDLPPALCDQKQAMRVASILLHSASRHAPVGSRLHASVEAAGDAGFLEIKVAYTSPIPVEEAKIATCFSQGEDVIEIGRDGTGLELYIACSLVAMHGGHLWLASIPGKGNTFHTTFPITSSPTSASTNHKHINSKKTKEA